MYNVRFKVVQEQLRMPVSAPWLCAPGLARPGTSCSLPYLMGQAVSPTK